MIKKLGYIIHREKNVFEYVLYIILLLLMYKLTYDGVLSSYILSIIVAIPTFGYLYAEAARRADVMFYHVVFYKGFNWNIKKYSESWIGILLEPILVLLGYWIGVMLCSRSRFVLFIMMTIVIIQIIQKILRKQ